MEDPEAYDECVVKVEREVKNEEENEDRRGSQLRPVEVNIASVKEERDSEEEMSLPVQVIVETMKQEVLSDEEELEPPAKVTIEDFKEDIPEGYYANVLPAGSSAHTSVSLSRPQTSLQLQWKEQDGPQALPAHIASNAQNCVTVAAPNPGLSWISTDTSNFSDGTLMKDGNVQYVLMTSADSFYVLENAENNAVCASDESIKNLISGNKNIQLYSIVPNQCTTSGNVVISNVPGEESGIVTEPERDEKSVIATSSSNKRGSEAEGAFSSGLQAEMCNVQPPQAQKKKKKAGTQWCGGVIKTMVEKEDHVLRKGCDVNSCSMRCSAVFSDYERKEIFTAFHSLPANERKNFIFKNCSRKIFLKDVKASDGTIRTTTHPKYNFQLKSAKGVPVHVCRLFFATTLGFSDFYFNCYLTDIYKNYKNSDSDVCSVVKNSDSDVCSVVTNSDSDVCSVVSNSDAVCSVVTECTCPAVHQKNRVKWFGSCKLHSDVYCHIHKDLFHKHIESFLRTLCIPQGELLRTIRYLPKDVSIEMMHQDFCRKHPEVNSSYELYKSFVVHFTS